jgi:hypothetical protein
MTETTNNEQDLTKSFPDGVKGPIINQEISPTDATSAVAPTSEEMSEANEESIAKADKCPTCGQSMPIKKAEDAEEMEKSETCADCGNNPCTCEKKSAEVESKEEEAKETPEDENKEMKKSLWDGSFSPNIKRGL